MGKPNFFIMTAICALVVIEILILKPSNVETTEDDTQSMHSSIEEQLVAQKKNDEIKYAMEGVRYVSVEHGKKNSLMDAKELIVFEKTNLASANEVKMQMFDTTQQPTYIESDNAYFKIGSKELDLEGNLKVTFPDDFWIKTNRAHYSAVDQKFSSTDPFYGESKERKDEKVKVWGTGFLGNKSGPDLHVLKNARVMTQKRSNGEVTDVRSDYAKIDRKLKTADFKMNVSDRLVEAVQGTLNVKSKKQKVFYDATKSKVNYMIAEDDVLIREIDAQKAADGLKYATCQRADFYAQENKIVLSKFPSVFQEKDTLTGDLITIYRDTNIVEVNEANAYHEGTE